MGTSAAPRRSRTVTPPPDVPSYVRPELKAVAPDLQLVDDLLAGTRRMWDRSSAAGYIRKWKDEKPAVYEIRRKCETLFEGLGRTLSAANGMLFAKPPQLTWNQSEAAMGEDWNDLAGDGASGVVFSKRFAEMALRDGLAAILVDHPPAPADKNGVPVPINAANQKTFNLRPTWARYSRAQIINWRVAKVANKQQLTLIVFNEIADVDVGDFTRSTVERFRVLRLVLTPDGYQATWTLFELTDPSLRAKAEGYEQIGSGVFRNRLGQIATRLPVSIAYAGRTDAPMTASIPLLGVAWANLAHWQLSTNLRFYSDLAAFPQPTLVGELATDPTTGAKSTLELGPLAVVHVQADAGSRAASFSWTELEGKSMDQLEKRIAEKLQQMSQLGMSFLVADTRAAETAEAKRLDAVAENSTLATAAQGIEDAANDALELHAWYYGIEKANAPVLSINKDFDSIALDAQTMTAYVQAVAQAGLPIRVLLQAWLAGGRLPPDTDIDALEAEMQAQVEADAEQKRLDAAARLKSAPPSAVDPPALPAAA